MIIISVAMDYNPPTKLVVLVETAILVVSEALVAMLPVEALGVEGVGGLELLLPVVL
jgi:hypothetical protein